MRTAVIIGVVVLVLAGVVLYARKAMAATELRPPPPPPPPNISSGKVQFGPPPPPPPPLDALPQPIPNNPRRAVTGVLYHRGAGKGYDCANDYYEGDPPADDPIALIYPDCHGIVGQGPGLTGREMIARYGVDKTAGMLGYILKNRKLTTLDLPIAMTTKEVNTVSSAWGGSVGYLETIRAANAVGAKVLALIPATRGIAGAYMALDKRLGQPKPEPIGGNGNGSGTNNNTYPPPPPPPPPYH